MTFLLEWVTDLLEYLNQTLAKPRKGFLNHLESPRYTPGCCQTFSANPWLRLSLHGNGVSVTVNKFWLHITNIIFLCWMKINCT